MDETLVVFTSDNGPSIARHERGGCAGLLRYGGNEILWQFSQHSKRDPGYTLYQAITVC